MIDLAYIASPSFSGSTLLTFALNAHPRIATVGELKWGDIDLDTYRCSCGALLRECVFWDEVVQRIEARGEPFDLHRPGTDFRFRDRPLMDRAARARLRGPLFEAVRGAVLTAHPRSRTSWPAIASLNRTLMREVMDMKGASLFVDASKDPVRVKHLAETGDFRIRLVHLIRDGRAVVYSAMKNEGVFAESAALEWKRTHLQISLLQDGGAVESYHPLRYEDFCTAPESTLRRLTDSWGLEAASVVGSIGRADHHILGNRMRLTPVTEIKLNEEWRTRMSSKELGVFETVAGAVNREFAYS